MISIYPAFSGGLPPLEDARLDKYNKHLKKGSPWNPMNLCRQGVSGKEYLPRDDRKRGN
jgi:hypothetical protein